MTKIMKKLAPLAVLAAFVGTLAAQDAAPAAAPAPAQPAQPQLSPEEIAELQKMQQFQQAGQWDQLITTVDAYAAKWPMSQYLPFAFEAAADANQRKGNSSRAVFYYEKVLALDPSNASAMLMIAAETAQNTREHDLDKGPKLERATKLVGDAMKIIPTVAKPNPQITDEQWAGYVKDETARAYMVLGLIAYAKPDYPEAAKQYQASIDAAASPDPVTYIRLGGALNEAKRYDEAAAVLDKAIAMPELPAQIKSIAEAERKRSDQLKAAGK